jgi:hypothetical protein
MVNIQSLDKNTRIDFWRNHKKIAMNKPNLMIPTRMLIDCTSARGFKTILTHIINIYINYGL